MDKLGNFCCFSKAHLAILCMGSWAVLAGLGKTSHLFLAQEATEGPLQRGFLWEKGNIWLGFEGEGAASTGTARAGLWGCAAHTRMRMVRVSLCQSILCHPGSCGVAGAGGLCQTQDTAELSPPGSPRPHAKCPSLKVSGGGTAFSQTPVQMI